MRLFFLCLKVGNTYDEANPFELYERPRQGGFVSLAPISDKTLKNVSRTKPRLKNVSRCHAWQIR